MCVHAVKKLCRKLEIEIRLYCIDIILDDAFTLYTLSVRNKYRVFHETWQLVNSFEYLLPYITIERYYERRLFIPFTNCYVCVHPVAYIYKIVYGFLKDWTRKWNLAASWTDWFKARRIFWKLFCPFVHFE